MIDQTGDLGQRLGNRLMSFRDDAGGAAGCKAKFLGRHHAFILAGGQSFHIGLQLGQPVRVGVDPACKLAQETRRFAALQRNVPRPFTKVCQ